MKINKGSSHMMTNINALKLHIYSHKPTICTITEANSFASEDIEAEFPDYDVLHKFETYHNQDRIILLIEKNRINYERVTSNEED